MDKHWAQYAVDGHNLKFKSREIHTRFHTTVNIHCYTDDRRSLISCIMKTTFSYK